MDGDVLGTDGVECGRVDDLRAEVAELHGLDEAELVDDIGCLDDPGVGGHEAVHIGPYLQLVGIEGGGDDAGSVVGAAASEVGDLTVCGVSGYEAGDNRDPAASGESLEGFLHKAVGDLGVEHDLVFDPGGLDEVQGVVERCAVDESGDDAGGEPLAEAHDLEAGLLRKHLEHGDAVEEGLELVKYEKETGGELARTDEALWAYIEEEAADDYCDGVVKVFGTWEKVTITIHIVQGEGVDDVQTNGVSVVGDLELSAETTTVALELVKDGLTIPVYKVITNDVTNVTQRVATYAVVEGLTYTFIAEEAEDDDPTVTPTDTKKAIIDAIDEENKAVVAPKIDAVVDTAEPPAAGKVSAKEMATWITEKEIQSVDMKDSNYLAASVNLDTSAPITDAAEVKFVEVEEDTSTGFTFDFELKLSGEETPEELEVEAAKLAGYIQTTGDLGTDFEVIGDTKRVTIDPDTGKVTITPDPTKSAEFFKIVIPKDPGAK